MIESRQSYCHKHRVQFFCYTSYGRVTSSATHDHSTQHRRFPIRP